MYNRNDWKLLTSGHISFVKALEEIEKINKKDKKNVWRLPTQKELQELPKEAQFMSGLNLSCGMYWTSVQNPVDENLQLAGYAGSACAHFMNIHRNKPNSNLEEVSLVVSKA